MRFISCVLGATLLLVATQAAAQVGPPQMWELFQNNPNPFCSNPGSTAIDMAVPQLAEVKLVVLSPDETSVLRTLVDGLLQVGMHRVIWDGQDAMGIPVVEGAYPYRMTATQPAGPILFESTRLATVECEGVGVESLPWSQIKSVYRR